MPVLFNPKAYTPYKAATYFDPDYHKSGAEVQMLFGADAEALLDLCMKHYMMTLHGKYDGCYHSELLNYRAVKDESAKNGGTLRDARLRLAANYPMAAAKQKMGEMLYKAECRRLRDGIDIIAKQHGFCVIYGKNYPDRFDFETWDGERVGAVSCM